MKKFTPSVYRALTSSGIAGVALSHSALDAQVQSYDFGVEGIAPGLIFEEFANAENSTGGYKKFSGIGFNLDGGHVTAFDTQGGTAPFEFLLAFKRWDGIELGTDGLYDARFAKIKGSWQVSLGGVMPSTVTENAIIGPGQVAPAESLTGIYAVVSIYPTALNASAPSGTTLGLGPLALGERGRVGFVVTVSETDVAYGWADMLVAEDEFKVYEVQINSVQAAVPEAKHSALLMAMGAAGMAMLRRRRASS